MIDTCPTSVNNRISFVLQTAQITLAFAVILALSILVTLALRRIRRGSMTTARRGVHLVDHRRP
jgi:hypothetical protein